MKLFNAIAVETGARCTRKCWFCPVAYNPRPNEFMPWEMIASIALELAVLKYQGRIELYMYNEPYLDKRMKDIIILFRKHVPKACIMLSTNADLIKSHEQFQEMFDVGLNQMHINIYSNVPRYRAVEKMIKQTTASPSKNVYTSIAPSKQEYLIEQKFDKKITPSSPKVGNFELSNRSGLIPSLPIPAEPLAKMCVRPFRSLQVNWKGEIVLCCNDNRGDVVCGTVQDGLEHVWTKSKILRKYRKKLLQKKRKGLPFCAPCSFNGGAYPHMIEKFWPELKSKK